MTQKITQMRLVRYLFTAVLALLFVNCSKGRPSDEPKSNNGEQTTSSNQAEDEISSKDYELSADGLTIIKWKNINTRNLDMNRDPRLRKVTFIGEHAFDRCYSLTSLNIANSVKSIEFQAFSYCSSLTSIHIPNSVTSIGWSTFSSCSSLTSINIPQSVTSIGPSAFAYCSSLKSVTIPSSVTNIGGSAFYGCRSLTSITIPSSVTSIGREAFADCSNLTSVVFKGNNPPRGSKFTDLFKDTPNNLKFIVPKGAKSAYIKAGYPEDKLIEQ